MKQKNVILMVVAVGCGLVAAFLTSQMSSKTVEQVEVVVAAKDLPVGTVFTKESLEKTIKTKKVPKDALPPAFVATKEELLEKRLSRPIRAEETINPADLNKGIALPDGHDLVALSIGANQAVAGLIAPGVRVDVMASLRLGNTLKVFKLLVNTLIVNVNQDLANTKNGAYPDVSQVGFALTEKEVAALELAKARNCTLTLKLRNSNKKADSDPEYNLDEVIKLLQDPQHLAKVVITGEGKNEGPETKAPEVKPEVKAPETKMPEVKTPSTPQGPEVVPAAPTIPMVKALVAKRFIEPNTLLTNDLVQEAFEWKELPKDFASDAVNPTDLNSVLGGNKAFKSGVSKNQWVTYEMLGLPAPKPVPQETFVAPKPGVNEPATPVQPVRPVQPPVPQRKFFDVAVHGATASVIHRYEELPNGKTKKVAELTPEQAAAVPPEKYQGPSSAPAAPAPAP